MYVCAYVCIYVGVYVSVHVRAYIGMSVYKRKNNKNRVTSARIISLTGYAVMAKMGML